jgi:sporulation protein YlmC with PRC-barrel domain
MKRHRSILALPLVAVLVLPVAAQDPVTPPANPNDNPPSMHDADRMTTALGPQVKASDIIGKDVRNPSNENLGEIDDIVVTTNGRISYAVLSFSTLLGLNEKLFAIPWSSLKAGSDGKSYTLDIPKEKLKKAPGFDKKNWPDMADKQWSAGVDTFYGTPPAGDRMIGGRLTQLDKAPVNDAVETRLGKVEGTIVDTDHACVTLIVIDPDDKAFPSVKDKYVAIPWSSLNCTVAKDSMSKEKAFVYPGDRALIASAASFEKKSWPDLNADYVKQVYAHFGRDVNADILNQGARPAIGFGSDVNNPTETPRGELGRSNPPGTDPSNRLGNAPGQQTGDLQGRDSDHMQYGNRANKKAICCSKVIGATVKDSSKADAGVVREIVFVPGEEHRSFLIVDARDGANRLHAIPVTLCEMGDGGTCCVTTTAQTISSSPAIEDADVQKLADDNDRCTKICEHYKTTKPMK